MNFTVDQTFGNVQQRPRSLSDSQINFFQKPWTTSQEKSLHILAKAERSRRKRAEKKLVNMLAYQSFEADFQSEFSLLIGEKGQETDGDESSSVTSSTTEG